MGKDSQTIILKIPEPIHSSGDHIHLGMETFGDAVAFTETPHSNDELQPRFDHIGQGSQWALMQVLDEFQE